jgi:hypothetical protein
MFGAFEQIAVNQQVSHVGGSDQEAKSRTGIAAQWARFNSPKSRLLLIARHGGVAYS